MRVLFEKGEVVDESLLRSLGVPMTRVLVSCSFQDSLNTDPVVQLFSVKQQRHTILMPKFVPQRAREEEQGTAQRYTSCFLEYLHQIIITLTQTWYSLDGAVVVVV